MLFLYFLFSFVFYVDINLLMLLMNALQIIFFMTFARLEFPSNAVYLNSILINVMTFDIVEPSEVLDAVGYDY